MSDDDFKSSIKSKFNIKKLERIKYSRREAKISELEKEYFYKLLIKIESVKERQRL